jgi:hypothetical protein
MLIYVDDNIVASSSAEVVKALLKDLKDSFALKDLGDLHYFLGIEVKRQRDGLILSQGKYAPNFLRLTNRSSCKPVSTPLAKIKSFWHILETLSVQKTTHGIEVSLVHYNT